MDRECWWHWHEGLLELLACLSRPWCSRMHMGRTPLVSYATLAITISHFGGVRRKFLLIKTRKFQMQSLLGWAMLNKTRQAKLPIQPKLQPIPIILCKPVWNLRERKLGEWILTNLENVLGATLPRMRGSCLATKEVVEEVASSSQVGAYKLYMSMIS